MDDLDFFVENLEAVPEALRDLYKPEADGKRFILKIKTDPEGKDLPGALRTLERVKAERKTLSDRVAKFAELEDSDVEAYKAWKASEAKRKGKKPKKETEDDEEDDSTAFTAFKTKWDAQKKTELDAKDTTISSQAAELRKFKLNEPVRASAIAAGAIAEDLDDLLLMTARFFELDTNGKPQVLDGDGDPSSLTIEKFWEAYKLKKPKFFQGTKATGGGSPATRQRSTEKTTNTNDASNHVPAVERLKRLRRGGTGA